MRPLRLELQGFAAFREPTSVDLEGIDLFALVGPTGSGKSTVIDAMCFALYGSVPRYEDRRAVAPAISAGALEARVSFTFEIEETRYTAVRVVRRDAKGGATTREARLEREDGEILAGTARELDPAAERLLGLSFEHFTRSVVLPQGEFQRFLHDKPRDRQGLLVELLGLDVYGRMMQQANQLAAEQETDIARIDERLEKLADCTPEERNVWKESVQAYSEFRQELRQARPALRQLDAEVEAAEAEASAARLLVELLLTVKMPGAARQLAKNRAGADAAYQKAQRDVENAAAETARREQALAVLPARDPLIQARDAHRVLGDTQDRLEQARAAFVTKQADADQAAARVTSAEEDLTAARANLEHLRLDHAAHDAAKGLRVGEPCPVCTQVVTTIPSRKAPAGLAAAKRAVEKCERELNAAARVHTELIASASAEHRTVADMEEREPESFVRVAEYPSAAEVETLLTDITGATETLSAARGKEKTARQTEVTAVTKLKNVDAELGKAKGDYRRQRDQLVGRGVQVPPEADTDLPTSWAELATWAKAQVPTTEKAATKADQRAAEHHTAFEKQLSVLRVRAEELDLAPSSDASIEDLSELAIEGEKESKDNVKEIEDGIKERKRLLKKRDELGTNTAVAKQLGQLLRADGFERWLVAEALETLVDGASARLNELSAGQYSFVFDQSSRDFLVVDHRNADERRSVRTLSGGETFQASLALALSLSDHLKDLAVEGAARLESIFLDEGFGTLDPETLDTVAATIESLGAGDRMVGVVTHVRDLAERLPVQYRVTIGSRTSTIDRVMQ